MSAESTKTNAILADLWHRFKHDKDAKARERIVSHYAYLVKITAGRVVTSLPPNFERDDLAGAGVVGLVKAVDHFDTSRDVKFETYAIALIRGAILEMLREQDWVPRSVRDNVKALEKTYYQLEVRTGRPATEDEVAAEMGVSTDDLQKILVNSHRANLLSLDDMLLGNSSGDADRLHLADVLPDENADVVAQAESGAMRRTLIAGIDRLPPRERLLVSLYYYDGLTFKEIGKVLAVSESRVYQLHTQAVLRLRGYLRCDLTLFTESAG